jgi:hypothetical protein
MSPIAEKHMLLHQVNNRSRNAFSTYRIHIENTSLSTASHISAILFLPAIGGVELEHEASVLVELEIV